MNDAPRRRPLRAAAFRAFCRQLSSPPFVVLAPRLLPWLERLASPSDFLLEELAAAPDESGWLWQYRAGLLLGARARGDEAGAALAALDRLAESPRDLVADGAAKGLAAAVASRGPAGADWLKERLDPGRGPALRRLGARALAEALPALWPARREDCLELLRAAGSDPDGRVRHGVGGHTVGRVLRGLDAAAAAGLIRAWREDADAHLRRAAAEAEDAGKRDAHD